MAAEQAMTTLAATHLEVVAFPIEGMTCASCVNRITRFLRKVDGVEEANVNLATESATVRYDGSRVDVAGLVAAVEAAVGPMTARAAISVGDLDRLPANAVERFGRPNAAGFRSLTMLFEEGIVRPSSSR